MSLLHGVRTRNLKQVNVYFPCLQSPLGIPWPVPPLIFSSEIQPSSPETRRKRVSSPRIQEPYINFCCPWMLYQWYLWLDTLGKSYMH